MISQYSNMGLNKVYSGPGYGTPPPPSPPPTNSWWGKQLRRAYKFISDRLEAGGFISATIGAVLDALVDDSWQAGAQGRPGVVLDDTDYAPSPFEEGVLNTFNESKFAPFFTSVVSQVDAALASQSLAVQLTAINRALYVIGVAREYFKTAQTAGLSLNGMQVRNESIFTVCDQLEIAINKILQQHPESFEGTLVQVKANPSDFLPFTVPASTYTVKSYQLESGSVTTAQPIATPSNTAGNSRPLLWIGAAAVALYLLTRKKAKK